ncbi:hypothetical protein [uncultured Draconibacterium sp.]|uniref:hypothetical protein n=1 Tax=uncultured Draconibacterium sp. TaxID=1573823 RepID=UPI0032178D55
MIDQNKILFGILILLLCIGNGKTFAQNPFLPPTAFIPDGEPRVFEYQGEKRLFIYGSRDEKVIDYCGYGHDVWSASVTDLTKWTNHGEIFNIQQVKDIGYGVIDDNGFGAPDCVYNPITRKYYLYTFMLKYYKMDGNQGPLPDAENYIPGYCDEGPLCVMAESDSPTGPFINPVICDWPPASDGGTFDPAVLVDEQEDGSVRVYAFWGKTNGDRWAEIDPSDMHSIIDPKTGEIAYERSVDEEKLQALYKLVSAPDFNSSGIDMDSLKNEIYKTARYVKREAVYKTLNNPALNNYSTLFEASSIRKVAEDKYVFIYSPNEKYSTLSYCYSNSPEGPWKYGGVIVDNAKNWSFGNNHGSIVNVGEQWYVVYHKGTTNSYNRQAMIEPIDIKIDGEKVIIPEVEMTSQGICQNGLDAYQRYNINSICYKSEGVYVDGAQRNPDGLNPVVGIENNSIIGVKYLNFGSDRITDKSKLKLRLNMELVSPATIISLQVVPKNQVNDESKRVTISTFKLSKYLSQDGKYHEVVLPVSNLDRNANLNAIGGLKGQMALLFSFKGEEKRELCRIKEYEFATSE